MLETSQHRATRATCGAADQSGNGFHWISADAFLFDIDGTLLNVQDLVHYNALNLAMREAYGVQTTIDGVAYHGMTDLGILRAALDRAGVTGEVFTAKLPRALEFVREYVAENAQELRPKICASVAELLAKLKDGGKLLGVASGNLESVGWHKINAAGLGAFFSFGCFSDHCEMRREIFVGAVNKAHQHLGRAGNVCFVGDTPEDIRAARHAGGRVVAVGTGIYKVEQLTCHEPDLAVATCADLLLAG